MDTFIFSLLSSILCLIVAVAILVRKTRRHKLPPGPARLPIIGNLHNISGENPHRSLADLAKLHGPLMSLKLGQVTTVVASSSAAAREVLQKHDKFLSDRHVMHAMEALDSHKFSLPWLPAGSRWRELRRVCNSHIFATQKLDLNEGLRREKVLELVEGVRRHAAERPGTAVDVGRVVFRATVNALSATVMSMDLADEERLETAREFKEVSRGVIKEAGKPNLGDYFPVLAKMDLQGIHSRMESHLRKVFNLFECIIEERLQKSKSSSYVSSNDVLDTILAVGDGAVADGEEPAAAMDPLRIKHLFGDLFVAGTDTTSSTMEWAMTELLRNPGVLARAKAEMEETIGKDNHLRESDICRLPYLQAVVKETFRLHPAVPLLLPRRARRDVEIDGFTVPEGAKILVNVWAIGRDPTIWEDSNSFVPERFLRDSDQVDVRRTSFELIPFGARRRICPGLPLAMRMLHMMLGSLVHWFDWRLPDGVDPEKLDMEEKFGITLEKAKPLLAIPTPT